MFQLKNRHPTMDKASDFKKRTKLDEKICLAAKAGRFDKVDQLINLGADIHARTRKYSPIILALKYERYCTVDYLLRRGAHFRSVKATGQLAGFTALHHACLQGDLRMVTDLLEKYRVDPTSRASDGVQPIHLAAFRGHFHIVFKILEFGANVDTKVSYSHYKEYTHKPSLQKWDPNFGDQMTLFAFLIINVKFSHAAHSMTSLFLSNPNLRYRDNNNKTLFMYAIENNQIGLLTSMLKNLDLKEINQHDDEGFTAVHSLLLKDTHNGAPTDADFWSNKDPAKADREVCFWLNVLDDAGADINVMAKGSPKTLPINIAASKYLPLTLEYLARKQTFFMTLGRPLFYFIKQLNENNAEIPSTFDQGHRLPGKSDYDSCAKTYEVIVEDICTKRLCGYPIHRKEIILLERLMDKDADFKDIYQEYEHFYKECLAETKLNEICFGSRMMSIYDVLMASQKEYIAVAKNQNYMFDMEYFRLAGIEIFGNLIYARLEATKERIKILEKWHEVATQMMKSLLVPYECALCIVENITNEDLKSLIEAYTVCSELINSNICQLS